MNIPKLGDPYSDDIPEHSPVQLEVECTYRNDDARTFWKRFWYYAPDDVRKVSECVEAVLLAEQRRRAREPLIGYYKGTPLYWDPISKTFRPHVPVAMEPPTIFPISKTIYYPPGPLVASIEPERRTYTLEPTRSARLKLLPFVIAAEAIAFVRRNWPILIAAAINALALWEIFRA